MSTNLFFGNHRRATSNQGHGRLARNRRKVRAHAQGDPALHFTNAPAGVQAGLIGQEFTFDFNSTKEGQGQIGYSLPNGPAWASIDPATGVLTATPARRAELGLQTIIVRMADAAAPAAAADSAFQVNVQGQVITLDPAAKATTATPSL